MRSILKLAALLFAALLLIPGADAAPKKPRKAKAGAKVKAAKAKAPPKVVVTAKSALRAEANGSAKALVKVKPKDKVLFIQRSPDGKWAQVKKGKVAGWISVDELNGVPSDATAANNQVAAPPTPVVPPPTEKVVEKPVVVEKIVEKIVEKPVDRIVEKQVFVDRIVEKEKIVEKPGSGGLGAIWSGMPLSGPFFSVGGGAALLGSKFTSKFRSGLDPELFKYTLENLPSVAVQARLGYIFGYKAFRVGVDGSYRFAGGTSIVVKLPEADGLSSGQAGSMPVVLPFQRQTISLTAHDAEGAVSIGAAFGIKEKIDLGIRARGGLQLQAFLPDFNPSAVLPKELLYGPFVGLAIDLQTRAAPGFGLRLEGGYIPFAVRQQNDGARDAVCLSNAPDGTACLAGPETSAGFNAGGSLAFRVVRGFDIELGYRMLWTWTDYAAGNISQRLRFDRDDEVKRRASTEVLDSARRETTQQTVYLGVAFRR